MPPCLPRGAASVPWREGKGPRCGNLAGVEVGAGQEAGVLVGKGAWDNEHLQVTAGEEGI